MQVGYVALNVLQICNLVASAEFLNMGLFLSSLLQSVF